MNPTEYRVLTKRAVPMIGLGVLVGLVCLGVFLATLQGHHATTSHYHPKEPLKFSLSKPNLPNPVGLGVAVCFLGFVAVLCLKQILHPQQVLLANRSGLTLGSSANQHAYRWTEVKGFSTGEVIITSQRGYGGTVATRPALKIEFADTVKLDELHSLDWSTSCRSPTEPNVFLINAQIFADQLEDVIQVLSRIKREATG